MITPATLSVKTSHSRTFENLSIPNLQISQYLNTTGLPLLNNKNEHNDDYIYLERFVEFYGGRTWDTQYVTGPSARMTQMIQATASTGEVFQKPRPVSPIQGGNLTYQVETISPGIRCSPATVAESKDTLVAAYTSMTGNVYSSNITINKTSSSLLTFMDTNPDTTDYSKYFLYYFAMVPSRNDTTKQPRPLPLTLEQTESYNELYNTSLANRLWIAISPGNASSNIDPTFISCQLWNVSYSFNISFSSDRQTTTLTETKYLNTVQPMVGSNFKLENEVKDQGNNTLGELGADAARMTYTMFFFGICERVTGLIYTQNAARAINNVQDGGIRQTILTGSIDYYSALINGQKGGYLDPALIQSLQPTNKSLSSMIEELAVNVTSNMLGNSYFRLVLACWHP